MKYKFEINKHQTISSNLFRNCLLQKQNGAQIKETKESIVNKRKEKNRTENKIRIGTVH
jgi:hypothetical protein